MKHTLLSWVEQNKEEFPFLLRSTAVVVHICVCVLNGVKQWHTHTDTSGYSVEGQVAWNLNSRWLRLGLWHWKSKHVKLEMWVFIV